MIISRLVSTLVMWGVEHLLQSHYGRVATLCVLAFKAAVWSFRSVDARQGTDADDRPADRGTGRSSTMFCVALGVVLYFLLKTQA